MHWQTITMDTEPVHRAVRVFTSQLSLVLIVPAHGGLFDLGGG